MRTAKIAAGGGFVGALCGAMVCFICHQLDVQPWVGLTLAGLCGMGSGYVVGYLLAKGVKE